MRLRFGGIASGLDTEQIVRDLMRAERQPLDKLFQRKVQAEWKRDQYRLVNTKLLRLRNVSFDLRLQSSFQTKAATSSQPSAISATTTGSSVDGSYHIEVEKLAQVGSINSAEQVDKEKFDNFKANGASIEVKGVNGEVETIEINEQDTLEDVLRKITNNRNLGVNAFYDQATEKVVFTTKSTGESAKIEIDLSLDANREFFGDVLGFPTDQEIISFSGTNAQLTINGLETEREQNTFNINGTNITLHNTTTEPIRIEVSQDVDKAVENIKAFVELYNEIISEIQGLLDEPRYRDFPPLTDEQKEAMSEREIEMWEEKAKSGMLRGDTMLSNILSNMRLSLTSNVEGLDGINSLSQIGITTGPWHEKGKLHINESKLREALKNDTAGVIGLFTSNSDEPKEQGIARKLYSTIGVGMDRITSTAGRDTSLYDQSFMGNSIRRYEQRMDIMEERLARVEQRYWSQFTAMERAMQEMNSQSDWLYQQLMAMTG